MVKLAAVVIHDRGDLYLPRMRESVQWKNTEPDFTVDVGDEDHRFGLAGAVREGWGAALERGATHVFHIEEDFVFNEPIDVDGMAWILERGPYAQVCLKRQADPRTEEAAAGGFMELNPDAYTEVRSTRQLRWTEHDRLFSLNPCLIPRRVLELGWPDGNEAEFTAMCAAEGLRFAYYGGKSDPPRVEHIGWQRSVGWRL